MSQPTIAILADDLIWSTRLADVVRGLGRVPITVRDLAGLTAALPTSSDVVIDLTSRGYDGIAAVEVAAHSGHRVLCVGQHDDRDLRLRAIEAGAERVYAYRVLFERGPATLGGWLASGSTVSGPAVEPSSGPSASTAAATTAAQTGPAAIPTDPT